MAPGRRGSPDANVAGKYASRQTNEVESGEQAESAEDRLHRTDRRDPAQEESDRENEDDLHRLFTTST
jgi:hypothetical protein